MGRALGQTARQLGCSERTLRRYATEGALRGHRLGPHRLELGVGEEEYLRSHWTLLRDLKAFLRTEREIGLAVLFGSAATGQDRAESDVDILIGYRRPGAQSPLALQARLSRTLGRGAHLITLQRVDEAPSLLEAVLREGRVLIDRDGVWESLRVRAAEIAGAARTEEKARTTRAREVLEAARARVA